MDDDATAKCRCGRPVDGTTLCTRCTHTLDVALANVAAHHSDLETLRTRSTRYGVGVSTKGSIGKSQPLGVDLRFVGESSATALDESTDQLPGREGQGTRLDKTTRATLLLWTALILGQDPPRPGPVCATYCLHTSCAQLRRAARPGPSVPSMCAYLHRQLSLIAGAPWAQDLLDQTLKLERSLERFVDRPAERWYAGKCSATTGTGTETAACEAELYARSESGTIRCPACGTDHDIDQRRDFLLAEARGIHVTASEAASALLAWTDYDGSETKLVDLIRKWRDRDRLEVQDVTSLRGRDRHLYRLGDIQDLLVQHAQREQQRRLGNSA